MYSFANREDTEVVDEPLYAYYLNRSQVKTHPGTKEILKSQPTNLNEALKKLIFRPVESSIYFIKGMAHHYYETPLDWLLKLKNVFLIRDPALLIPSFAKVIDHPRLEDIGLKREFELYRYLVERGKRPLVVDSEDILSSPETHLSHLCDSLDIPFDRNMLNWPEGPIDQDGVWAEYWYHNVHKSTEFGPPKTKIHNLTGPLKRLYVQALPYYEQLKNQAVEFL